MSSVRTVDFNSLPQHIRERLVASFQKQGWPQPILSDTPSFGCAAFGWGFLALNALGISPRDLIAILQAIKASGALQAEIEVL